ncbi:MAG: ABC transporter permease [Geminicoccaceae bacterium]
MLKVEPRREISTALQWATPVLAVALTIVTGFLLFTIMGVNPFTALYAMFISPLRDLYGISELCLKATPLILCATGLAIGFRAGVWNIGAEGQLTMGAIFGGGIGLFYGEALGPLAIPVMCLAGVLGGMLWAAIPAFLKTRWDVNEILTSLMLTYVATLVLSTLVYGPWKDPDGFNFPQSKFFADNAILPIILSETRLHVGFLVTLLVVAGAWVLVTRSLVGFQVRVIGSAPEAAAFAGFSRKRLIWLTMLLSGGLAGLAGLFEVAGPIGQLVPRISPGYGFTAIIVAFLARLHPVGIVASGFLIALSFIGGENAQVEAQLPQATTGVFQGLLLFWVLACDFLVRYRVRFGSTSAARASA